ncbi:hypothetical protein PCAU_1381 [Pseudomonas chlororaphis subsp. aurantiaca]|nr:hypothetical protein PCAU_1381 [Pseudomonas chlororaphis subsp. aurantiaca]
MGRLVRQQLRGQLQAAVAPEGQFLAVLQMHGHRALRTGHQLIPGEQTIAFYQGTPAAIRRDRYYLPDYLTDDAD